MLLSLISLAVGITAVRPDNGGLVSNTISLGGIITSFPVSESIAQSAILTDSPITYICSANNASPAVTIKWYITQSGGARTEITSGVTTDDQQGADMLYDSTSVLVKSFDFNDCGAQIVCEITHPETGLTNGTDGAMYTVGPFDVDSKYCFNDLYN